MFNISLFPAVPSQSIFWGARTFWANCHSVILSTRACWDWSPGFPASGCQRGALWLRLPSPRPAFPETRGSCWTCPCAFCKHNRDSCCFKIWKLGSCLSDWSFLISFFTWHHLTTVAHCYRNLGDIGSCHVKTAPIRKKMKHDTFAGFHQTY